MGGKHRIVLGRYQDAKLGASKLQARSNPYAQCAETQDWSREIHDIVEVVRYHMGNAAARVAYAYFHHRRWESAKMKRSTFYKILKKVKLLLTRVNIGQKRHRGGNGRTKP